MKWRKKKENPNEGDDEDEEEKNEPKSKKPSSALSKLSKILHFPACLAKFRPNPNTKQSTAPLPKPSFSLPPPPDAIPRRLPVGGGESRLNRSRAAQPLPRFSRHNSIGSELDLRADLHLLGAIQTSHRQRRQRGSTPNPNPIRDGRRSFGGRIRPKVRVFSPRLANPNSAGLERYAVVKRSKNPVRDFRESMVDMICERGIGRSDELESLLACYLWLNSDEHHDVIIKVFREVWFDFKCEMKIN